MQLELTGAQKRQLRDALVDAFRSWDEMRELTLFQLDVQLGTLTSQAKGLAAIALDLIEWFSQRGDIAKLIVAARNERPRNPRVGALADLLSLSSCPVARLEAFVNDNTLLLDVATWREGQAHAEWRVCRIDRGAYGVGTGILVGRDLVLTNYHVIQKLLAAPGELPTWKARFDHKVAPDGSELISGRAVAFAQAWDVDHARYSDIDLQPDPKTGDPAPDELDYALVRLAEPIGELPVGTNDMASQRGWVSLAGMRLQIATQRMVTILQHPTGGPMKLAIGMAEKMRLNTAGNRVRHGVPTLPGSSGSPLFDQDWKLIALHHAGDPNTVKPEFNEAIPIELIAARPKVIEALAVGS